MLFHANFQSLPSKRIHFQSVLIHVMKRNRHGIKSGGPKSPLLSLLFQYEPISGLHEISFSPEMRYVSKSSFEVQMILHSKIPIVPHSRILHRTEAWALPILSGFLNKKHSRQQTGKKVPHQRLKGEKLHVATFFLCIVR